MNKATLLKFLIDNGLPDKTLQNDVNWGDHGNMDIKNLNTDVCQELIMNIDKKIYFDKKLHCRPIIGLTPEKVTKNNRMEINLKKKVLTKHLKKLNPRP